MRKILLTVVACIAMFAQAQWSEQKPVSLWGQDVSYPDYMMKASNAGYTWMLTNNIAYASNGEASELYYAQGFDQQGNPIMGDKPYQLSDAYYQTYIMVEDNLLVDSDSNGLFGVLDHRDDEVGTSISIYKISPEGKMLWGENGIQIQGDIQYLNVISLCGIQLEDNSYVFAWMAQIDGNNNFEIVMQRVYEDGKLAWEPYSVGLSGPATMYQYPHLENAGNNQYLLCYAYGSTGAIQVMKYDFDGTPVWTAPAEVYNGSWGSTPLWLKIDYAPSGDGGMLIAWYADPDFVNMENAYLQYVTPDGKLGFNAKNGLQVDYADYIRHLEVKAIYDPTTDSFIVVMKGCDPNQYNYCIKAQRVSKSGDLLWGEEGYEIEDLRDAIFGYASLQLGNPGEVAFFYEMATDDQGRVVSNMVSCYDIEKCEELWYCVVGNEESPKGSYSSVNAGSFWTVAWLENSMGEEGYSASKGDIYAMRVNYDGSQGSTAGICSSMISNYELKYNCVGTSVEFDSPVTVYDVNGRKLGVGNKHCLSPGIYIATDGAGKRLKVKL